MIKICSLDFLNREVFETDIMTVDGEVLFPSGEKITPEILLRLYFKEIYIAQPLADKERVVSMVSAAVLAEATEQAPVANVFAVEADLEVENNLEVENLSEENIKESQEDLEEETKKKSKKGPKAALEDIEDEIDTKAKKGPKAPLEDIEDEVATTTKKGPKAAGLNLDEDEVDGKSPRSASAKDDDKDIKGPKQAGINLDSQEGEQGEVVKGPKAAGLSKFEVEEEASARVRSFAMGEGVEIPAVEPENEYFEFDEAKAKRMVKYSLQLGKLAGYSKEELKELEVVAYNSDIGITRFKKTDINKKGFRKMKSIASYEKLKEDGIIPYYLAEMVKSCTSAYESDTLSLEAQTPYSHIVSIVSFYEDSLSKGKEKSEILLKMLQLGGHQFNIFVLHKFIKMMREAND